MGRRALPKIDPTLDLSQHYREQATLPEPPQPFDARQLFHREAPLEIEIGSGKGLFLRTAARDHPERNFLGIEIARKYARFAASRLARADLVNALMIQGDGVKLFTQLPSNSVNDVHVYFPDPWWKKRHRRRRVMNEAFVRDVERVLVPAGVLHFWTDVREYFETTLELIAAVSGLSAREHVEPKPAEHDLDYRTHFERRMRLHDLDVFRARFRKKR